MSQQGWPVSPETSAGIQLSGLPPLLCAISQLFPFPLFCLLLPLVCRDDLFHWRLDFAPTPPPLPLCYEPLPASPLSKRLCRLKLIRRTKIIYWLMIIFRKVNVRSLRWNDLSGLYQIIGKVELFHIFFILYIILAEAKLFGDVDMRSLRWEMSGRSLCESRAAYGWWKVCRE